MPDFTYKELALTYVALEEMRDISRMIANDRSKSNTKENRGLAREQVKTIRIILHKLDKELENYPDQSFSYIC